MGATVRAGDTRPVRGAIFADGDTGNPRHTAPDAPRGSRSGSSCRWDPRAAKAVAGNAPGPAPCGRRRWGTTVRTVRAPACVGPGNADPWPLPLGVACIRDRPRPTARGPQRRCRHACRGGTPLRSRFPAPGVGGDLACRRRIAIFRHRAQHLMRYILILLKDSDARRIRSIRRARGRVTRRTARRPAYRRHDRHAVRRPAWHRGPGDCRSGCPWRAPA